MLKEKTKSSVILIAYNVWYLVTIKKKHVRRRLNKNENLSASKADMARIIDNMCRVFCVGLCVCVCGRCMCI